MWKPYHQPLVSDNCAVYLSFTNSSTENIRYIAEPNQLTELYRSENRITKRIMCRYDCLVKIACGILYVLVTRKIYLHFAYSYFMNNGFIQFRNVAAFAYCN